MKLGITLFVDDFGGWQGPAIRISSEFAAGSKFSRRY
jgi:hypothetical protein